MLHALRYHVYGGLRVLGSIPGLATDFLSSGAWDSEINLFQLNTPD